MIIIFSDFGISGPYSGTMRSVVMRIAPTVPVCDLMVDAPDRNPKAASYLLAALCREFKPGDVVLAVVDPGVGSARKGLVVDCDGVTFVGPDNGLFEMIMRRGKDVCIRTIDWQPDELSASFHGRDIFAPVAAMIATDISFEATTIAIENRSATAQDWPDQLDEVIYVDTYGNLMSGMSAPDSSDTVMVNDHVIVGALTFSDVKVGQGFHYRNSIGLCEIAVNCGRADQQYDAQIGTRVSIRRGADSNL